jgi:hypothetical protein
MAMTRSSVVARAAAAARELSTSETLPPGEIVLRREVLGSGMSGAPRER